MKNAFTSEQNSRQQRSKIATQVCKAGTNVWAMTCKHAAPLYILNMHFCIIFVVANATTQGAERVIFICGVIIQVLL